MIRNIFACVMILVCSLLGFADQYEGHRSIPSLNLLELILAGKKVGIVNENRVNIRSSSDIKATQLSQANRGDIVQIYDEKGTGVVIKGIWDYWYRISEFESRWVNAFFVDKFPIQFLAKKPPNLFINPKDKTTRVKLINNTYDIVITRAPSISDRSKEKYSFNEKQDYWYYISELSGSHNSIVDDTWIHGNEIEPFLGAQCRRLEITDNPFLINMPRVINDDISTYLQKPISVENIGQEYEGFLPTIRYNYGAFVIDMLDKKEEKIQFLFRVILKSPVRKPFIKYGIDIGLDKNFLEKALGTPDEIRDQYWIYSYPEPLNNTLYITINNDLIVEVAWVAAVP